MARSHVLSAITVLGVFAIACSSSEDYGHGSFAILNGTNSSPSENVVVGIHSAIGFCTGTLVAPNLVLTASHCVRGADVGVLNDLSTCRLGGVLNAPAEVTVSVGASSAAPDQTIPVSRVFADLSQDSCTNDVAALELAAPVQQSLTFHPLQLDAPVPNGEPIESVGFGYIDDLNTIATTRQTSTGIIEQVNGGTAKTPSGSTVSTPAGYIVTSTQTCSGDSGSPLFDVTTGALLGTDLGGTQGSDAKVGTCSDDVGVYVQLWSNATFVENAFRAEGLMPWRAGRPNPPSSLGGTCTDNKDCNSDYCIHVGEPTGGAAGTCSKICTSNSDCTSPMSCDDTGQGVSVCMNPTPAPAPRGCDIATVRKATSGHAVGDWLIAAALALSALGRRREVRG